MATRLLTRSIASIFAGLTLTACHFLSETNLITPEMRVNPFGSAGAYIVPDSDGGPFDEALLRLPDGGFLALKSGNATDLGDVLVRYDFAGISEDQWPAQADAPLPGTPYLASMCEIRALDATNGCWLLAAFVASDGRVYTMLPTAGENDPETIAFTDPSAAIDALHTAWVDERYEMESHHPFIEMTDDLATELDFNPPAFR